MSETHDPWDYLAEFIEGNAVRPPGGQQAGSPRYPLVPSVARELRQLVVAGRAARAAEATQHQQEIAELEQRHADELAAVRSSQQLIDQIATLRAERDRLKAALSTAAFALDLAGFRRDRDAAYAALTPQGQSTDGETR